MNIQVGTQSPPYPKIRGELHNIRFPCYTEIKLDGEANIYSNGMLISKASGKIRTGFAVTQTLAKIVDNNTIIFGELHWGDGKSGALYDFLSHATDDKLNFTIFDVHHPTLGIADYETRREWMIEHILGSKHWTCDCQVRITRPMFIENRVALDKYIQDNRDDGWEGLVVKNKDSVLFSGSLIEVQQGWVKIKHKTTGDYEVIGIDPVLERMDICVPLPNTNVNRTVGVKLVHKYKPHVAVGDWVEIEHQGQLTQGGLRHPNFMGKVTKKGKQYDFGNVSK